VRADAPHHQRVAIGRRFGNQLGGDVAARSGAVLDHHRLPPGLAPAVADEARIDVGDAADRKRNNYFYRFGGIVLREH
jgi:hypothetical protein